MAKGATPLVVYRDRRPVGLLHVADPVRSISRRTVARFEALGIRRMAILSGDHRSAVERVAASVGIGEVHARLRPHDKVEVIRSCQSQGLPVMFVGDGTNDAPALAVADVGVAMAAAGTDVALETADIALTHDDISKLPWLVRLARRMLAVIRLNIVFGLLFNAAAVVAGGMGWLSPILAAVVHNVGSVLVVLASASLAVFAEEEPRQSP